MADKFTEFNQYVFRAHRGSRWRHRYGGDYTVLCVGIVDAGICVVYNDETVGTALIMPASEFFDGRFERIPTYAE